MSAHRLTPITVLITFASLGGAMTANAGLITTTISGNLIVEAISSEGGDSTQEFGLGTSAADAVPIFTMTLQGGQLASCTPSCVVDVGYFIAGSSLDFYNISSFGGTFSAYSSNLGQQPSASDLVVFTDRDNSLGFGGSVVELLGANDWIFHLDDAASFAYDDDDNELVIRLRVIPSLSPVPEPATLALLSLGLAGLSASRRRKKQ